MGLLAACALELVSCGVTQTENAVFKAGARCAAEVPSGASGPGFVACMDAELGDLQGRDYQELIRNFSCSQDDVGTLPTRTINVTVPLGYDACEAAAAVPSRPPQGVEELDTELEYMPGVLPGGNDLPGEEHMDAQSAARVCLSMPECAGFTFQAKKPAGPGRVFFKSTAVGGFPAKGWHTYRRKVSLSCSAPKEDLLEEAMRSYHVDIVREEPLVAVIRNFATSEECESLVSAGGDWDDMSRAYTSGGGFSQERRSYSSNIYPPLSDPEHELTRLTGQMFSVTRSLTGYEVYPPGQEPVNAVLYKHLGDEYRPHCDGSCTGGQHRTGERIATSIVYCRSASKGGQTSFTEGALKVQPGMGDMLLFAYRYANGSMTGREAEHSGCPIREGKKWIATQWYREGLSDTWNWEAARNDRKR